MKTNKNLFQKAGAMLAATLFILAALSLGGCSSEESDPMALEMSGAPTMPVAEDLKFDFTFFDDAQSLNKGDGTHDNFVNAYLRVIILDALAHLTLAYPVDAFASALHADPVAQEDGSWLWAYGWRYGPRTVNIELTGLPTDLGVEWEMRILGIEEDKTGAGVVWFYGLTSEGGDQGHWYFVNLDDPEMPVGGEIMWGDDDGGRFLEFISREDDSYGDSLKFSDHDPEFGIVFTPGNGGFVSVIEWNADSSGSLTVPDYNHGVRSCWDVYLEDIVCAE